MQIYVRNKPKSCRECVFSVEIKHPLFDDRYVYGCTFGSVLEGCPLIELEWR